MFLFFGGDQRKYPVLKSYSFHNSPLFAIHVHSFPFITLIYLSLLFPCLLLSCNSLNFIPSPPFPYAPFLSFPFPIFPYPFLSSPFPFLLLTFPILSCCSFLSSLPLHSFPILSFAFVSSPFLASFIFPLRSSPSGLSPHFHSFHVLMLPFPFLASFNFLSFLSFPFLSFLSFPYASVSCPFHSMRFSCPPPIYVVSVAFVRLRSFSLRPVFPFALRSFVVLLVVLFQLF